MKLLAKIFRNLLQIIAVCILLLEFSHGKPKLKLNTMSLRTAAHAFSPSKAKFIVGGFARPFGSSANSNKSVAKREIIEQILPNDTEKIDWQRSKRSVAILPDDTKAIDWQRSKRSLDNMIQNEFNATNVNVTPQRFKRSVAAKDIILAILPNDTKTIDWQRSKRSVDTMKQNDFNASDSNVTPQRSKRSVAIRDIILAILPNDTKTIDWQRSKRSEDTMKQNDFNASDSNVTPQRSKRSVHSFKSSLTTVLQELDTLLPQLHYHDRTKRSPCKGGGSGATTDDGAVDYEDNIDLAERRKKAARRRKAAQQKKSKNSRKNSKLVDNEELQQTLRRRKREADVDKATKDISGKVQQIGETVRGVWESFAQTMSAIAERVQQAVKNNGGN